MYTIKGRFFKFILIVVGFVGLLTAVSIATAEQLTVQKSRLVKFDKPSNPTQLIKPEIAAPLICNASPERFNSGIPLNWTVINNASSNPVVWTDIGSCGESGNWASGDGEGACASSDLQGPSGLYDTELRSPSLNFTTVSTATLTYIANYQNFSGGDFLDLGVSTDGGNNWTTLLSWNEDHPATNFRSAPGEAVTITLDAYAHEPDVMLRWHYHDPIGPIESDDWYVQVDNVGIDCGIRPASIFVTPDSISSTQATNTLFTETLTIRNDGTGELTFTIDERTTLKPAPINHSPSIPDALDLESLLQTAPDWYEEIHRNKSLESLTAAVSNDILWDQPDDPGNSNGGWSDYLSIDNAGLYSADDFVLTDTATIKLIFADGFDIDSYLPNVPVINWYIYPDGGGAPAGHPGDDGSTEIWHYSSAPGAPGVDLTNNKITLDLPAAGENLVLTADTYWLIVVPTYDNHSLLAGDNVWIWFDGVAHPNSTAGAMLIDPTDYIGNGFTTWTPWSLLGINELAFRVEGTYPPQACPATADLGWVSVSPNAGTIQPDGEEIVDVVFDSAGLASGVYSGTLCISSNDLLVPKVIVPISLTVELPIYGVDIADNESDSALPGELAWYTLWITNTSNVGTSFDLSSSGESWVTNITPNLVSLAPNESQSVMVSVAVPIGTFTGEMDGVLITATQVDGGAVDSVTLTTTADTLYDGEFSNNQTLFGLPGQAVTFTVWLTNTGNGEDDFDFNVSGHSWTTIIPDPTLNLQAIESGSIEVIMTIPTNAFGGESDTTLLTAVSQGDPDATAEIQLTTVVSTVYEVVVGGGSSAKALPGTMITFTVPVTNMSTVTESFDLSAVGDWVASVTPETITLSPNEGGEVAVKIGVPASSEFGEMETAVFTAMSQSEPAVKATNNLTTIVGATYFAQFSAEDDAQFGLQGEVVTYSVTLLNNGNMADSYSISLSGAWAATTSTDLANLASGESVKIWIWVEIPAEAEADSMEETVVTAVSTNLTTDITLTTTAGKEEFFIYMPIVQSSND